MEGAGAFTRLLEMYHFTPFTPPADEFHLYKLTDGENTHFHISVPLESRLKVDAVIDLLFLRLDNDPEISIEVGITENAVSVAHGGGNDDKEFRKGLEIRQQEVLLLEHLEVLHDTWAQRILVLYRYGHWWHRVTDQAAAGADCYVIRHLDGETSLFEKSNISDPSAYSLPPMDFKQVGIE
jgi:hypothetical protein